MCRWQACSCNAASRRRAIRRLIHQQRGVGVAALKGKGNAQQAARLIQDRSGSLRTLLIAG